MIKFAIDTETSGFSSKDKIIEIAAVAFMGKEVLDIFHTFIDTPGFDVPPAASAVNGINSIMLRGFPQVSVVTEDFKTFLKKFKSDKRYFAYNSTFDSRMIKGNMLLELPFEDVMKGIKRMKPDLDSYKLSEVKKIYNIKSVNHGALGDALSVYHLVNILGL